MSPRASTGLVLVGVLLVGLGACSVEPTVEPAPPPARESTTPATAPTTTPTDEAEAGPPRTTVTIVGDIMLGRGVATQPGGAAARLKPMARHLRAADLTIGNLESTLSDNGAPQQPGDDSFSASRSVLDALDDAGIDALSLANNHTGDFEERALLETVRAFDGSGIVPFGAGKDLRTATRPAVLTRNGIRFGFLGFNAIGETPQATATAPGVLSIRMPPRTGPLNKDDLRHVLDAVRRLERRVDVVTVLPHWGGNYTHVPVPEQRFVGRRLIDAGADLVAGGHPHWVQGVERYNAGFIAHSLGNFVFDMDFMEQTMQGVTLTATFRGDELRDIELTPYRLDATFTPRPVTGALAREILADVGPVQR